MKQLWYLASPYSRFPHGIEAAFRLACEQTAFLIRHRVRVYSPIAHSHPVAIHGGINPYDHSIWLPADKPFMLAATGLIILRAESWEKSVGIEHERNYFALRQRPIVYMDPNILPAELAIPHD